MAKVLVNKGKELAESIARNLGIGLESVSEIDIHLDIDITTIYVWYSHFANKMHDRFRFFTNDDFAVSLCDALGFTASDVTKLSINIPNNDLVSSDVTVKLTTLATSKLSELKWNTAFQNGQGVGYDSTVAREDIGDAARVDKED